MSGSSHNRRKNSSWSIVTSETGFAHAGPIVDDKSGNFFVAHAGELRAASYNSQSSCERKTVQLV